LSITLNKPETRPNATWAKLISFKANAQDERAEVRFEVGYGSPMKVTRRFKLIFDNNIPDAHFTFDQLLQAVPQVRELGAALEQKAIDLGVFDGVIA